MGENRGERIVVSDVFREATTVYRRTIPTGWLLALALLVPTGVVSLALGSSSAWILSEVVFGVAIAWLVGSIAALVQAETESPSDAQSVGALLRKVWPRLLSLSLLTFASAIAIGFGLAVLVVPGVILCLMWIVAIPAMVVEERGVFDSLGRSFDLTRGNWRGILLIVLTFIVIELILPLPLYLASFDSALSMAISIAFGVLVYPYLAMLSAVLYFRLKGEESSVAVG